MSLIKQHLLKLQEEEQELWQSYLEYMEETKDIWNQLPLPLQGEEEEL